MSDEDYLAIEDCSPEEFNISDIAIGVEDSKSMRKVKIVIESKERDITLMRTYLAIKRLFLKMSAEMGIETEESDQR